MVAGAIKHPFVSAKADGGDATLVKPSNWNEDHEGGISILDRDLTQQDVENTVVETSIYSFSIPAGVLGATGGVRLTLFGDALQNTGANRDLTVRVKLGATTVFTSDTPPISTSGNRRKWKLEFVFLNSAADAQKWGAFMNMSSPSANNFALSRPNEDTGLHGAGYAASVEDTSGALTLSVTVQLSVALGTFSFRKEMAVLELLSPA